jgi:hypothetical protein
MNYNAVLEIDDRETTSDFLDLLYVEDLFNDSVKFNEVLDKVNLNDFTSSDDRSNS